MNDEQLDAQLNNWVSDKIPYEPINSGDLASRVRTLKAVRSKRRTMILTSAIATSAVAFVSLCLSASYFHGQNSQDQISASPFKASPAVPEFEAPSDRTLMRYEQLAADLEHTQFKLDLLAINIRVQQVIGKADRMLLECDLLANQEKQAAMWLAATLQEMPIGGSLK